MKIKAKSLESVACTQIARLSRESAVETNNNKTIERIALYNV
jgi:hypothetical protein